jgi:hypothetical protein
MPGGGSRIAANHINATARPDGLTIGIWNSAFAMFQALGDTGIKFDARKVGWLGASTKDNAVCAIMGFTGQKTWKDIVASGKELHFLSTAAARSATTCREFSIWWRARNSRSHPVTPAPGRLFSRSSARKEMAGAPVGFL